MSRKHDPLANLFDGQAKTAWWSYARGGDYLEIDLGAVLTIDRLVIDRAGVGPNPWPYEVYSKGSTYRMQVSVDGEEFRETAEGGFGPAYTIAAFDAARARYVRIVIDALDRTSAYDDPTWHAKDVYIFEAKAGGE